MVVSKPKSQALFAVGVFVVICLALGGYNLNLIIKGSTWFFNWIMVVVFLPIGLILTLRQLFNYKIISLGNEKVQVWYPLRFRTVRGNLKDMDFWEETEIKTRNGLFKQLEIKFPQRSIKMSIQENTSYEEAVNYLKKKQARKRK